MIAGDCMITAGKAITVTDRSAGVVQITSGSHDRL
jgi:hypothetical protein